MLKWVAQQTKRIYISIDIFVNNSYVIYFLTKSIFILLKLENAIYICIYVCMYVCVCLFFHV